MIEEVGKLLNGYRKAILTSNSWLLGLGPEAYVEEPKKLRDMVMADMKKALVQYEGLRPAYQEPAVLDSRVDYVW